MTANAVELPRQKRIALIALDASKPDLPAWVKFNQGTLSEHQLFASGVTGKLLCEGENL